MARFAQHISKTAEIVGWQIITKSIGIFAFAHATRMLGPDRLGISGVVLSVAVQLVAVSSLLNEAFLSRRFRRARTYRMRQALITAATTGRLVLAFAVCVPGIAIGVMLVPSSEWRFSLFTVGFFIVFIFLQPSWLLIGQDATQVIWRVAGVGSLVTSGAFFLISSETAWTGIDLLAMTVGAGVTAVMGWRIALQKGYFHFRISMSYLRYTYHIMWHSRWLFCTYLFANIYLYLDTFLLGWLGSPLDAGVYRPAANLSASFHQAMSFIPLLLYPRLLDWAKDPRLLWRRQCQIALLLLAGAVVGTLGVSILAKPLFLALYGESFVTASGPFALLIVARSLGIVASVFTWSLIAVNRDKQIAVVFLGGAVVCVVGNLILIPIYGIWGPAWAGLACDVTILAMTIGFCIGRRSISQNVGP